MFHSKLSILIAAWATFVVLGFASLLVYSNTPCELEAPEMTHAEAEQFLDELLVPGKLHLIMGIHPHCPCTRSSVGELEKLITKCREDLSCTVLVYRPAEGNKNWQDSDILAAVERLPNTNVVLDDEAEACELLNLKTSGSVVLFGIEGELLFYGGITSARGHHGDNIGSDAILSFVRVGSAERESCPVYGCPIVQNDVQKSTEK